MMDKYSVLFLSAKEIACFSFLNSIQMLKSIRNSISYRSLYSVRPHLPARGATQRAMRATAQQLQHTARLTLFTRSNCSLCDSAKSVLQKLAKRKTFEIYEVDVMAPDQSQWRKLYEFDTPVVRYSPLYLTSSLLRTVEL